MYTLQSCKRSPIQVLPDFTFVCSLPVCISEFGTSVSSLCSSCPEVSKSLEATKTAIKICKVHFYPNSSLKKNYLTAHSLIEKKYFLRIFWTLVETGSFKSSRSSQHPVAVFVFTYWESYRRGNLLWPLEREALGTETTASAFRAINKSCWMIGPGRPCCFPTALEVTVMVQVLTVCNYLAYYDRQSWESN